MRRLGSLWAAIVVIALIGPRAVAAWRVNAFSVALIRSLSFDVKNPALIAGVHLSVRDGAALSHAIRLATAVGESNSACRAIGVAALAENRSFEGMAQFGRCGDRLSHLWLARELAASCAYRGAAQHLRAAIGNRTDKLLDFALHALAMGNLNQARALYEMAVASAAPGNVAALIGRGHIWQVTGEFDRAVSDFDAAIRDCPSCYQAYLYRGQTRMAQGGADDGLIERDLAAAYRIAPGERDARLGWTQWLVSRGRFVEAEPLVRARVAVDRPDAEDVLLLGVIFCRTGRADEARRVFESTRARLTASEAQRLKQFFECR